MTDEPEVLDGLEAQRKAAGLQELVSNEYDWTALYRDPVSGTLWKESYPSPETHGGGPPRLEMIDRRRALLEFDLTEGDLDE